MARVWVDDHHKPRPKRLLPPPSYVNILYKPDGLFLMYNGGTELLVGADGKTPFKKPDDITEDEFAEYLTDARRHAFWVAGTNGDPCVVCMPRTHRYNQQWANESKKVAGKAVQKAVNSQKNLPMCRITDASPRNILYGHDGSSWFRHEVYAYPLILIDGTACRRPDHSTDNQFAEYLTDPNLFTLWIDGTHRDPRVIFMAVTHELTEQWLNDSNIVTVKAVQKGANSQMNTTGTKRRITQASSRKVLFGHDGSVWLRHDGYADPLRYVGGKLMRRPAHLTAKDFSQYVANPEEFTFWAAGTRRDPCVICMPVSHILNKQWADESKEVAGETGQKASNSKEVPYLHDGYRSSQGAPLPLSRTSRNMAHSRLSDQNISRPKREITRVRARHILHCHDGSMWLRHDGYADPLRYVGGELMKDTAHLTARDFAHYLVNPELFTFWVAGTYRDPYVVYMPVNHRFNRQWANESKEVARKAEQTVTNSKEMPYLHNAHRSSQGAPSLPLRNSHNRTHSRVLDQNMSRPKRKITRIRARDILYCYDGRIWFRHDGYANPLRYVEGELMKRPAHMSAEDFTQYLTNPEGFTFWVAGTYRDPCITCMPVKHKLNRQWADGSERLAGKAMPKEGKSQATFPLNQAHRSTLPGSSRQAAVTGTSTSPPHYSSRSSTAAVQQPFSYASRPLNTDQKARVRPRRSAAAKGPSADTPKGQFVRGTAYASNTEQARHRWTPSWLSGLFRRSTDGPVFVRPKNDRSILKRRR